MMHVHVCTLHELVCVRKVVTHSLSTFLLVYEISGQKHFFGFVIRPVTVTSVSQVEEKPGSNSDVMERPFRFPQLGYSFVSHRCGERLRPNTEGCQSLEHTRWSGGRGYLRKGKVLGSFRFPDESTQTKCAPSHMLATTGMKEIEWQGRLL